MLAAGVCAANAGGWEVVGHARTVFILRVPCSGACWASVTVVDRGSEYTLRATTARAGDARPCLVHTAAAPVSESLAVFVYTVVLGLFRDLQCAHARPSHYRWDTRGADLVHTATHMASAKLACRVVVSHWRARGPTWYFVLAPPGGRVAITLQALEIEVFCKGRVKRQAHGGVYDTRRDCWRQLPQTSRAVQWLFTSIVTLATPPPRGGARAALQPPAL